MLPVYTEFRDIRNSSHGCGFNITNHVRQKEMEHFPRNAPAVSNLIWTTMWTGIKELLIWPRMIHCALVRRIFKDIDDRRFQGPEVFIGLDFVSHIHNQHHRHNCACLVQMDEDSGGDPHTCSLSQRPTVLVPSVCDVLVFHKMKSLYFLILIHLVQ